MTHPPRKKIDDSPRLQTLAKAAAGAVGRAGLEPLPGRAARAFYGFNLYTKSRAMETDYFL